MSVPRRSKAKSASSDAPSRQHSRSDASDQTNSIFGPVGSRTRSRSTSDSAHGMQLELELHLNEIAIKKERTAKKDDRVENS